MNSDTERINILKVLVMILILATLLFSACSTTRKCDGRKGVKTPMGLM